jgi:hypothetical protein
LTAPAERPLLEPFATVLIDVIVPEATRNRWSEALQTPAEEDLIRISRRIDDEMARNCSYHFHPAIHLHALMVCVYLFYEAASNLEDPEQSEIQTAILDEAYALLRYLVVHHGLYDMYMRLV